MSLASQMLSDVQSVFLNTKDLATTMYRQPARGSGQTAFVGVFDLRDSTVDTNNGKRIIHKADLYCDSATVIENEDLITVGSDCWAVHSVGVTVAGMKMIQLQRVEQKHQGSGSR